MEILKKIIKTIVFSNKMTANIYHKLQYGVQISDDLVITKIKQIAHRFDHRLMDGISINRKDIYEIEYFLDIAFDREIKFDDSLMWALSLYSLAKYNGAKSYKFKIEKKSQINTIPIYQRLLEQEEVLGSGKMNQ